ncbi:MAG: phage head morphogenesis protein [Clostridia bacterium]|nr:phage head morphogenesis protein [Clostridia bacterium]
MYTPSDIILFDAYEESNLWKNWMARLTPTTCQECRKLHGTIYPLYEPPFSVLMHPHCQCIIVSMRTKKLGYVTQDRWNGADVYISCLGKLPDNYVTKDQAKNAKWDPKKANLSDVLPGKMIGGGIYKNTNHKLPETPDRIWYEADIDYESGYRNHSRIVYSNDGLIFATYDHYQTFYEVLQ